MTLEQLRDAGFQVNKWQSLTNKIQQILFSNEGSLFISKNNNYYLEDSGLLFVRYGDGKVLNELFVNNNDDFVEINENNNIEYMKPVVGGHKDRIVGIFHELYDTDEITMVVNTSKFLK